jgi:hypothetical protein
MEEEQSSESGGFMKKNRVLCDMANQPSKAVLASAAGGVLRLQIGGG